MMEDPHHTLKFHDQAVDTLADMGRQADMVYEAWHHWQPEWAAKPALTLGRQLARMAALGFGRNTEVYRDGDLSLFVRTETGFVFGMIFHRLHRPPMKVDGDITSSWEAPYMGRYCLAFTDGKYCCSPFEGVDGGKPTCAGHDPVVQVMPVPGGWSFHS